MVEDPLSENLLKGTYTGKETVTVGVHEVEGEKQLKFECSGSSPEQPVLAGEEKKA
jgi:hypothetical protein